MKGKALVVDVSADRTAAVRGVLDASGVEALVLTEWLEAAALLQVMAEPLLLVLGYEALAALGCDAVWAADTQLRAANVPSVVLYSTHAAEDVRVLERHGGFSTYLPWPASRAELLQALARACPARSWQDVGFGNRPVTQPRLQAPATWFDLRDLELAPVEQRRVVPIPSLSHGLLADIPTPRLLYYLGMQQRSGVLRLRRDGAAVEVRLRNGAPLCDDARSLAQLRRAFSWDHGEFGFEWEPVARGQTLPLLEFLYDALKTVRADGLLAEISEQQQHIPAYTTLLMARAAHLRKMGRPFEVARACGGVQSLSELLGAGALRLEDVGASFAFGLVTDAIVMLEAPGACPVGVSYQLHARLAAPTVGDASAASQIPVPESRSAQHANQQALGLEPAERQRLERLERTLQSLAERSPYLVFNVPPGCGLGAAEAAYRAARRDLAIEAPTSFPPSVRITARLVEVALHQAYQLLCAHEASRSGPETPPIPNVVATEKLSEAEQALVAELELRLEELTETDAYRAFGIWEGCGRAAVEEAFDRLRQRLRPARYAAYSSLAINALAALVYAALLDACERLLAVERGAPTREPPASADRGQLFSALEHTLEQLVQAERTRPNARRPPLSAPARPRAPRGGDPQAHGFARVSVPSNPLRSIDSAANAWGRGASRASAASIEPQRLFAAGCEDLARKAFEQATVAFEAAAQHEPENGLYEVFAAWATFLTTPETADRCALRLKDALSRSGGEEMGTFFLGMIALRDGELDRAERWLTRTVEVNANNAEARRATRLIRLRRARALGRSA